MDELLQQVAEQRRMPASLVQRSAQAKADKTGTTVEAVLREWVEDSSTQETNEDAPVADVPPESEDENTEPQAGEPVAVSTDYLVELAAEAKRMPPRLILTSAQARSSHSGTSLEEVLADWAGVDLTELEAGTSEVVPAVTSVSPDAPPPAEPAAPAPASPKPAATATAVGAAAAALTMDQLLDKVAEVKGMPASLAKRSAEARSKKTGEPVEAVLAEWAGVDVTSVSPSAPPPAEPAAPAPASPKPAATATAVGAAAAALTMDQLLDKVAEVKGMPASLAKRSAEARSKKTGEPVEAVLAEWAGVDVTSVSPSAPPPAEPAAPAPASPKPASAAVPIPEEKTVGDDIELIEAEPRDTSENSDAQDVPPTKRGKYPVWLAAAFVLIPLLAVAYILVSPNGPDCGSGGQLGVDPVSGEAVNCDGSEYGVVTVDNFAAGGALYQQCVACHSDNGSGGVGPAFSSGAILVTFPSGSCSDHIEWVSLGTGGWPESTYGATDRPVGGIGLMPAFGTSLTQEQIAQVSLYERVAFGGQDVADAEVDCGLVEAEDTPES